MSKRVLRRRKYLPRIAGLLIATYQKRQGQKEGVTLLNRI